MAVKRKPREQVTNSYEPALKTFTTRAGITSYVPRGPGRAPVVDKPLPRPGVGGARTANAGGLIPPLENPPVPGPTDNPVGNVFGFVDPFTTLRRWIQEGGVQQGVNSVLPDFLQPSTWMRGILFLFGIGGILTGTILFIRG